MFSSDHAAWRDTPQKVDDMAKRSLLRWTDVSLENSVQFWRITPAGFGSFFDIRSGHLWLIVASPRPVEEDGIPEYFSRWDRYLQDFNRLKPTFSIETPLEAIRLEPGNRL